MALRVAEEVAVVVTVAGVDRCFNPESAVRRIVFRLPILFGISAEDIF
jgi:hypothetical protein